MTFKKYLQNIIKNNGLIPTIYWEIGVEIILVIQLVSSNSSHIPSCRGHIRNQNQIVIEETTKSHHMKKKKPVISAGNLSAKLFDGLSNLQKHTTVNTFILSELHSYRRSEERDFTGNKFLSNKDRTRKRWERVNSRTHPRFQSHHPQSRRDRWGN